MHDGITVGAAVAGFQNNVGVAVVVTAAALRRRIAELTPTNVRLWFRVDKMKMLMVQQKQWPTNCLTCFASAEVCGGEEFA